MGMMSKKFFQCGMIGWTLEIFWTGLHAFRVRDPKLTGNSSLWMFPIYGSAAFLSPMAERLKGKSFFHRGLIYMCCIYLGEYVSGSLLKRHDMCPWDYSRSPYQYHGVIRLDYAPIWFLVGLMFEKVLRED
jgi:uncharacterized membrane protein